MSSWNGEYNVFEWDKHPDAQFAITTKGVLDFECDEATNEVAGDTNFSTFAAKPDGMTRPIYCKTKAEYQRHKYLNGGYPYGYYVFVWTRDGKLIDGAY